MSRNFIRYVARGLTLRQLPAISGHAFEPFLQARVIRMDLYRHFHVTPLKACSEKPSSEEDVKSQLPDYVRNHVFLSDMPFYFLPNFWKSIKNRLFEILIRGYFDQEFSISSFIDGAEQAALRVSAALADGNIEYLEELDVLSPDLVAEIKENMAKMPMEQRYFMKINPSDVMRKFVYEIGVIIDEQTEERFVEITFVMHGQHGISEFRDELHASGVEGVEKLRKASTIVANAMQPFGPKEFVCNLRFVRQFRKPSVDNTLASSHWIINKLNYFRPIHFVMRNQFEQSSNR